MPLTSSKRVPSEAEVKEKALELSYDDVGICSAKIPQEDIEAYHQWIEKGSQAEMAYMENDLRCHPDKLLPGAKTAILFVSYYKQPHYEFDPEKGLIASYARGRDYHNVHHSRLKRFIRWLEEYSGETQIAKGFSDSTPILEKALAVKAGLGWFGKNTLLIHRKFGTFTLLSGCVTTLEIPFTPPRLALRLPRCGTCTLCMDSCPTQALNPYHLDAKLCLSYQTIESKKRIPESIRKKNPGYLFGCDICQDVCPHNVRKPLSESEAFSESSGKGPYLSHSELMALEPEELWGTPLKRKKKEGLINTSESLFKMS